MAKRELTKREKAILRLYVVTGEKMQVKEAFTLAYDGGEKDIALLSTIPSLATRWMQSPRVVEFLETERAAERDRQAKERARIESAYQAKTAAGSKRGPGSAAFVDYGRPENQMKKLNELINQADDPGEALDALKVVISRQEALAPEKRTAASKHRVYLPLRCETCPLYQKEKLLLNIDKQ